jgi:predicted Zn-dependent protease
MYFARLPAAIEVWTRVTAEISPLAEEPYLSEVRKVLNRRRYEDAKSGGNVDTGVWSKEIALYARDLRAAQKSDEALAVLAQLIVWAPSDFEAQIDFAEATKDVAAARVSALVVWDNAEDEGLRARAAKLTGRAEPKFASLDFLEPGMRGLQVVLVPLPPCDLRLIEEAARQFSSSFEIPVKIARLPVDWTWQAPDRVYREREVRATIMQKSGGPVDFGAWSKDRYATELAKVTVNDDPLARYWIADFLKSFDSKPEQYNVDRYLAQLGVLLKPFRDSDRRTMFVGVTGNDIYSGDANFLFSGTTTAEGNLVSLLSYARMRSSATGEAFESRKRVVQRLAKEMVPAALKQIEIARPADPTDPYSYSSGVQRLDEKSLTLSTSTREALDKFRAP